MRIISGIWKGRGLKAVKGDLVRPTADKVKGAIFNILGSKVNSARILDLFAGTGNLALEALSRGAESAVLVENNKQALQILRENLAKLGAENRVKVFRMDAFAFLKLNRPEKFDIIFIDPPYHRGMAAKAVSLLKNHSLLSSAGVIVLEAASDDTILDDIDPLEVRITKEYGNTKVWFIQLKEKQGEE